MGNIAWNLLTTYCQKAQAQEITDLNFQMIGGQIRTNTPMGLRFIAKIKKDYIAPRDREGKVVEYKKIYCYRKYI